MNQSASRILTGVVAMVSESFSKPMIGGVFVPAIVNPQFGKLILLCKFSIYLMALMSGGYIKVYP